MVTTGIEGSDYINASYVNVSTVMASWLPLMFYILALKSCYAL